MKITEPSVNPGVITHFPTHVQKNGRHGLFVLPFISEVLAKLTGKTFVPAMNGIDSYDKWRFSDFQEFQADTSTNIWTDISTSYKDWLDRDWLHINLKTLEQTGAIFQERRLVTFCSNCWKVEFLTNTITQPKYLKGDACIFCGEKVSTIEKEVLLYSPRSEIWDKKYSFEPQKFTRDIRDLSKRLMKMEYLVSRSRETWISYLNFQIDPDFYWSTFLNRVIPPNSDGVFVCTKKIWWRISLILSLHQDLSLNGSENITSLLVPYLLGNSKYPLTWDVSKNRYDTIRSLSWGNEDTQWRISQQKEFDKASRILLPHRRADWSTQEIRTLPSVQVAVWTVLNRKSVDLIGSTNLKSETEAWISQLIFV
jgi:hypothetical protein